MIQVMNFTNSTGVFAAGRVVFSTISLDTRSVFTLTRKVAVFLARLWLMVTILTAGILVTAISACCARIGKSIFQAARTTKKARRS